MRLRGTEGVRRCRSGGCDCGLRKDAEDHRPAVYLVLALEAAEVDGRGDLPATRVAAVPGDLVRSGVAMAVVDDGDEAAGDVVHGKADPARGRKCEADPRRGIEGIRVVLLEDGSAGQHLDPHRVV